MDLNRKPDSRFLLRRLLMAVFAIAAAVSSQAQQFPNQGTANYNWGVPYGSNYNYGFMRYGQGGFGASPYNAMAQPQFNSGMPPAGYNLYGTRPAGIYQGANQDMDAAAAQAMELRFDVRNKSPRTVQSKQKTTSKLLTRNQVLDADGKVLWPGRAPKDGELGKSRASADEAIETAYKDFKANGKASVQNVVEAKERLYSYGHPALDKAGGQSRQAAQSLHRFLYSLERAIDSLGGV